MSGAYYEFYCPVKVIAGHAALEHIPFELAALGARRPLLVTDAGVRGAGLLEPVLAACAEGVGGEAEFRFADAAFLAERGLGYPIWVPPTGETAGFHRVDVSRAVAAGLSFRPHAETARDTLAWMRGLGDETASRLVPAQLLEGEAEALAAWKSRDAAGESGD